MDIIKSTLKTEANKQHPARYPNKLNQQFQEFIEFIEPYFKMTIRKQDEPVDVNEFESFPELTESMKISSSYPNYTTNMGNWNNILNEINKLVVEASDTVVKRWSDEDMRDAYREGWDGHLKAIREGITFFTSEEWLSYKKSRQ